jgi:hypothetical protein
MEKKVFPLGNYLRISIFPNVPFSEICDKNGIAIVAIFGIKVSESELDNKHASFWSEV